MPILTGGEIQSRHDTRMQRTDKTTGFSIAIFANDKDDLCA